jgi:hypothetical protein
MKGGGHCTCPILRGSLALAPQDDDAACHIFIDVASLFALPNTPNLAQSRDVNPWRPIGGAGAVPAGGVRHPPPGGPGIVPFGTTTGARGAPLKCDWRCG